MTRSSSAGADSVGRFLRTQRFRASRNTQNLWPYPACVSVICRRMLHWCVGVRIESTGMAPQKAADVASSHGLPSGSTCGAIPGMVAGPWRDRHESVC